jgi:hypothetical protein
MKKPYKRCTTCGKKKSNVRMRTCGYMHEIHDVIKKEQICDDCEHEHLMDI